MRGEDQAARLTTSLAAFIVNRSGFARPQSSQQIGALKQIKIVVKYIGKTGKGDRGRLRVRREQQGPGDEI
jgi:hypothetical protein